MPKTTKTKTKTKTKAKANKAMPNRYRTPVCTISGVTTLSFLESEATARGLVDRLSGKPLLGKTAAVIISEWRHCRRMGISPGTFAGEPE